MDLAAFDDLYQELVVDRGIRANPTSLYNKDLVTTILGFNILIFSVYRFFFSYGLFLVLKSGRFFEDVGDEVNLF